MRRITLKSADDPHLLLKQLLLRERITADTLSKRTGISYDKLVRTLRNEREFTASEIGAIAHNLGITDIDKYFLRGI